MSKLRIGSCVFLLLALASALMAVDVSGVWKSNEENGQQFVFTLRSEANTVTGTMLSMEGKPLSISNGKLDGDKISFTVASEWQGQPVTLDVSGTVAGDQMQLHVGNADGSWGVDVVCKHSTS